MGKLSLLSFQDILSKQSSLELNSAYFLYCAAMQVTLMLHNSDISSG